MSKDKTLNIIFILVFVVAVSYICYQVTIISQKISEINISNDKLEFIYGKVNDLVNVLDTKEEPAIEYSTNEKYDLKSPVNELVSESAVPASAKENSEALKEELAKMNDGEKLKIVKDKLVDIYQKSRVKNDDFNKIKQSFYETKSQVEVWYNQKKGISKSPSQDLDSENGDGILNKLKKNLGQFVEINKLSASSNGGKTILNIDQIPQMLSYAEVLLDAGSLPQVAWIMEDIQALTKQEGILVFTSKIEIFNEKYPNPNSEIAQIKELIDIVENQK